MPASFAAAHEANRINRERKAAGLPPLPRKGRRSPRSGRSTPQRAGAAPAADATILTAPPAAGGPPPAASSHRAGTDFSFVIDSAAAMTGLVCFMAGIDSAYAPTHQEIDQILTPLLRILSRRVSVLSKLGPDAEDAALALVGILGYTTRLISTIAARRAVARSIVGTGYTNNGHPPTTSTAHPGHASGDNGHVTDFYQSILARASGSGAPNG